MLAGIIDFRLIILVALATLLTSCGGDSSVRVLKMAHGLDTLHPVHLAMERMAERVEELSAGTLQVDIHPNGQLGGERELLELLQIGSIALTKVSTSPLESFVPEFQIFSLPYVFRDEAHFWDVLNSDIGDELLLAGESARLRGLGFYDAGSRNFYTTTHPIEAPSDLRGQKIRVQNSGISIEMIQALGGAATPMAWAEIYTALQQRVVDGAENNIPSYYLSKHYEVAPFLSLDEHTFVPDILLVSAPIWDSLTPVQQRWLQQAADESVSYQRQLWKQTTDAALQELKAVGVTIIRPDPAPFQNAVEALLARHLETPLGRLLRRIEAQP